jgi:hypothetical protein
VVVVVVVVQVSDVDCSMEMSEGEKTTVSRSLLHVGCCCFS